MRKTLLLLVILVLGGGSAFSQVLGRVASSYNNKWGFGVNAGTNYAIGKALNSASGSTKLQFRQAALNPTFSLDFWREGFTEPWFTGVLLSVSRSTLKYSITIDDDDYDTTLISENKYWNILGAFYVGYRFSDKLTASLGVSADISSPRGLSLFANRYRLGLIAMARYFVSDNFYATARVQGGMPVFRNWGGDSDYWQETGVPAIEKDMGFLSFLLGIGFSF